MHNNVAMNTQLNEYEVVIESRTTFVITASSHELAEEVAKQNIDIDPDYAGSLLANAVIAKVTLTEEDVEGSWACFDCELDIDWEDEVWHEGEPYHTGCCPNEWNTEEESAR